MSIDIIHQRLNSYPFVSPQEEINALKEIYQEIALAGLARGDFFKLAAFQGETALRIVHGLKRFSEDLDFILMHPMSTLPLDAYLETMRLEFQSFGILPEIKSRGSADGNVKKAFLKDDSYIGILELKHPRKRSDQQKLTIKIEIDTSPPEGSLYEAASLSFPYPFPVMLQDLPSLFASKLHAILCRRYEKGRDWFDFLWYLEKNVSFNEIFLKSALEQFGPYAQKDISSSKAWLREALKDKIEETDWDKARKDIENFLNPGDRRFVAHWSKELFLSQLKKL